TAREDQHAAALLRELAQADLDGGTLVRHDLLADHIEPEAFGERLQPRTAFVLALPRGLRGADRQQRRPIRRDPFDHRRTLARRSPPLDASGRAAASRPAPSGGSRRGDLALPVPPVVAAPAALLQQHHLL